MKVRLNLATAPLQSNRRFVLGAATVGSLAVIAMFILSWHAYADWRADKIYRAEELQIETDMSQLRARRAGVEAFFTRPNTVQARDLSAFLNELIAQRAFPWTQVFMDLERDLPEGVRVVNIEPRLEAGHVQLKLTVGAINDDVKLKFLKSLEDSKSFSNIEVLGESNTARPNEPDKVLLSLLARYSAA